MIGIELVVFDIGGTTMVDNGQVPRAFEEVVRRHGIAMTPDEVVQWRGTSKREAVAYTKFFIVSVATTSRLSPSVYAATKRFPKTSMSTDAASGATSRPPSR